LPGRGSTTFLKRQKEQQRAARANAKRAARQARRDNRQAEGTGEVPEDVNAVEGVDPTAEPNAVDPTPEPDAPRAD
jgi:hypothetical protein